MEDKNVNIKVTVQTDKAVENLDDLKKSADKAAGSVEKVSKAGKDVDKSIPVAKDVGQAWEQAFDDITEALGPTGESLRKIFTSVKAAIPVVKALNNTAVTGLSKIKWAIAASGIGLLVLAVGELAAHWEDISRWLGVNNGKEKEYAKLQDDVSREIATQNLQLERERDLLEANGATKKELAKFDYEASGKKIALYKKLYYQTEANNKILGEDKKNQMDSLLEMINAERRLRWETSERAKTESMVDDILDKKEKEKKRKEELEQLKKELQAMTDDAWSTLTRLSEAEEEGLITSTKGYFTELLDPQTATQDTDKVVEYIEKAFNELNSALGTNLKVTANLYDGLLEGDRFKNSLNYDKLTAERESLFAEGQISLEENLQKELEIEKQAFKQEAALLLKRKEFLEANGSGQDLEETLAQLDVLKNNWIKFQANQNAAIEEESSKSVKDTLDSVRKTFEAAFLEEEKLLKDKEPEIFSILNPFKRSREYEKNQIAQVDNLKKYYEQLYALETNSETKASILESLEDLEKQKTEITAQGALERKQIRIEEIQSYADAANSIADIVGTVAEAEEERIQRQLDAGKISEEAARSQFETVKQWQYAQTWINTIAGMTAALTAPSLQSNPAGWVAAATQAASLLATGIAQTIKIKNTEFGGGGVSSGGSGISASPSVTPIDVRNDIQQSPTVLPDSQSPRNQRVYILERDIQDSNRRVEVRENNSTF